MVAMEQPSMGWQALRLPTIAAAAGLTSGHQHTKAQQPSLWRAPMSRPPVPLATGLSLGGATAPTKAVAITGGRGHRACHPIVISN